MTLHIASFQYIEDKPGDFIHLDTGQIVGCHKGLHYWTVGQGLRMAGYQKAIYVQSKNTTDNSIIVVPGYDHPALRTDIIYTDAPYWIATDPLDSGILRCQFRFQHSDKLVGCVIVRTGTNELLVKLDQALSALTPGQYAVFYKDGECLGSSRITSPGPSLYFCRS